MVKKMDKFSGGGNNSFYPFKILKQADARNTISVSVAPSKDDKCRAYNV